VLNRPPDCGERPLGDFELGNVLLEYEGEEVSTVLELPSWGCDGDPVNKTGGIVEDELRESGFLAPVLLLRALVVVILEVGGLVTAPLLLLSLLVILSILSIFSGISVSLL
jgi:hypothetical protein